MESEPKRVTERVLIVEDDAATRAGLTELVRTWGFITESAADGNEGLQKVASFRPAIVVTDLVMPRMDGMALLKALREQDDDVEVVILTAQGTIDSAVEAVKQKAYDYLTKPVDPQRLRILLDKVVERQEMLREVKVLRRQLREQGTFGKDDRRQPADVEDLQGRRAGGPDERLGADLGRIGNRQGARCADDPPAQSPRHLPVRADQLRGNSRDAAHARQQDARGRDPRHQSQNAPQQAQ